MINLAPVHRGDLDGRSLGRVPTRLIEKSLVGAAIVSFAAAVGSAVSANAQAPEMLERVVGEGWSISHPTGWIVNIQALPAIATDEAALATCSAMLRCQRAG